MHDHRSAGDLIRFDLEDEERHVLQCGLVEWGGAARCTDELALAMGFASAARLLTECKRLIEALDSVAALSRSDWRRVLVATEIVFVSDVFGAGVDWSTTTGLSDAETLTVLRRIQRKVAGMTTLE